MDSTKNYDHYFANIAMGYGGRAELMDSVKEIVDEAKSSELAPADITEEFIHSRLLLKNDIDMVIRTGDVIRTSNFFPWQTAYAEWFFVKKMWPEFTKVDLKKCLEEYSKRERRMGK